MDERGVHFRHLPPGFKFHPSDEELIVHYLLNKVKLRLLPATIIGEINLYNYDPWDLPDKALFGKDEWFFFTPRDRKYPNGSRPNRSAGSGFWKATGKDKEIFASSGSRKIGLKKALAFFRGSPTKNFKTNWIMNEFRLPDSSNTSSGSMRLDDWVLCRISHKGNNSKNISRVKHHPKNNLTYGHIPTIAPELPSPYMFTNPNLDIVSNHRFKEIQLMASILAGQTIPTLTITGSPKLLQHDNNGLEYGNEAVYEEIITFDEAHQGWIM